MQFEKTSDHLFEAAVHGQHDDICGKKLRCTQCSYSTCNSSTCTGACFIAMSWHRGVVIWSSGNTGCPGDGPLTEHSAIKNFNFTSEA